MIVSGGNHRNEIIICPFLFELSMYHIIYRKFVLTKYNCGVFKVLEIFMVIRLQMNIIRLPIWQPRIIICKDKDEAENSRMN